MNRSWIAEKLEDSELQSPGLRSVVDPAAESAKNSNAPLPPMDPHVWGERGLDTALYSVERIQRSLIRVAELLRETSQEAARRMLAQCLEGLDRFFDSLESTKQALGLDFSKISYEGVSLLQLETESRKILQAVAGAQAAEALEDTADIVEYELLTNLYSWMGALNQVRKGLRSQA